MSGKWKAELLIPLSVSVHVSEHMDVDTTRTIQKPHNIVHMVAISVIFFSNNWRFVVACYLCDAVEMVS